MTYVSRFKKGDEIVARYELAKRPCLDEGKVYTVKEDRVGLYVDCRDSSAGSKHYLKDTNEKVFMPFIQNDGGWIGVDLDGTLAVYDGWRGPYHIGHPIKPMVQRILRWLEEGRDVRIFTARMTDLPRNEDGTPHDLVKVRASIDDWCRTVLGRTLPVTNVKDWHMTELWDDRAVQVRPNTGITLADELEAIRSAEAGKAATP